MVSHVGKNRILSIKTGYFRKKPGTFVKKPGTFGKKPGTFGRKPGAFGGSHPNLDEGPEFLIPPSQESWILSSTSDQIKGNTKEIPYTENS